MGGEVQCGVKERTTRDAVIEVGPFFSQLQTM